MVKTFYQQAVEDIFIGRHFRVKQEFQGPHPLKPPLEAFTLHLERIKEFWEIQLLEKKTKSAAPFQLIKIHAPMKFTLGELHRWLLLFRQTLEKKQGVYEQKELFSLWRDKIDFFEKKFKSSQLLFAQS